MSFWELLTTLWDAGVSFMNNEIAFLDVHFTLWQAAIGLAVISLLFYAIFRCLD